MKNQRVLIEPKKALYCTWKTLKFFKECLQGSLEIKLVIFESILPLCAVKNFIYYLSRCAPDGQIWHPQRHRYFRMNCVTNLPLITTKQ